MLKSILSIPNSFAFDFIYSIAIIADSFIILPKFPVIFKSPFPGETEDSMKSISPPTDVQASPVTTPATRLFS